MKPTDEGTWDIVLIGRKLADNENLGLGYLLAAARRAGLRACMVPLNGWMGLDEVCRVVAEHAPRLVGLAFPDGGSALLPLTAGQLLRSQGYQGHITAGGPFATLAREWLLERHDWLDSVVRYAGEIPLVALAERLASRPEKLDDLPGLTTRAGDGAPAPVLDPSMLELVPERGELPSLLGHPMAQIAATRGCQGRCAYCGPASLQTSERREGKRGGHRAMELIRAGVGGVRRRTIERVCDEMAELWHGSGVRYFYFVDEHLLPRHTDDALDFLSAWKKGLAERDVGPLGIGCMLRGDRLDERVIDAFASLGLIRTFVGIELASNEELRAFGRGGNLDRALSSMHEMERRGVVTTCNMMLLHPYSTVETLSHGIDFLETMGASSFEATQMQIYFGTKLHDQMAAEGRVSGNPLLYGYRYDDEAMTRFTEVFARLRMEAFGDYSMAFKIHDAGLAVALAERLGCESDSQLLRQRLRRSSARSNTVRIRAYRDALRLAVAGASTEQMSALVATTRHAIAEVDVEVELLSRSVLDRALAGAHPVTASFAPMKAAAAGVVTFVLSSQLVACQDDASQPKHPASDPSTAVVELGPRADASSAASASASARPGIAAKPEPNNCSDQRVEALQARVGSIARAADTCNSRTIQFGKHQPPMMVHSQTQTLGSKALDAKVAQDVETQMSNEELACLVDKSASVVVQGTRVRSAVVDSAITTCKARHPAPAEREVAVELDVAGKVLAVHVTGPDAPLIQQCISRALGGLSFPCLSKRTVAPQPVIME